MCSPNHPSKADLFHASKQLADCRQKHWPGCAFATRSSKHRDLMSDTSAILFTWEPSNVGMKSTMSSSRFVSSMSDARACGAVQKCVFDGESVCSKRKLASFKRTSETPTHLIHTKHTHARTNSNTPASGTLYNAWLLEDHHPHKHIHTHAQTCTHAQTQTQTHT